jgi:hypothetical protein
MFPPSLWITAQFSYPRRGCHRSRHLGGCIGSDMGHFLGHEPGVAKIHMGYEGTARANMIKILISLALLKLRI